jgi:hypothetical protein
MKTQAAVPADLRPSYVEQIFDFRVSAVPGDRSSSYRIEVRSQDAEDHESYALYYRPDDFSLERVTRRKRGAAEETASESSHNPFIYYQRRLPIIPDFPVFGPSGGAGRSEFMVAGNRVVQEISLTGDQARITLERIEVLGSLRIVMEWAAGDPWWSTIECSENPPPNAPFEREVVASGHLLKK